MVEQRINTANPIVLAAAAVVVIAGLKFAGAILIPLLLATFIAILAIPLMRLLVRFKVPEAVAVLIILALLLGLVVLFASFIGGTLTSFYRDIPIYEERFNELAHNYIAWLRAKGFDVSSSIIKDNLNPGQLMRFAGSLLNSLRGMLTSTLLILLIIMFILLEATSFPSKLKRTFGETTQVQEHFKSISDSVQFYLRLKTIISLLTAALVWIVLTVLDVPYASLWALIAFLFNYIPTIGSIVASIPAVLVALIMINPITALIVAISYTVINTILGSVIEPRLMGNSLGISPLVVFLSLVFWGWLWGPIGMILSVPLTMLVKITLGVNPQSRWLSTLLGR